MNTIHWPAIIAWVVANLFRAAFIYVAFSAGKYAVNTAGHNFENDWTMRAAFYLGALVFGYLAAEVNMPSCDPEQYDCPSLWQLRGHAKEEAIEAFLITVIATVAGIERAASLRKRAPPTNSKKHNRHVKP